MMWNLSMLPELAHGLDPAAHSFTYTYPPPYFALAASHPDDINDDTYADWPDFSGYIHIPFCKMNCRFCSLHREVVRKDSIVDEYLLALNRELKLARSRFGDVPLHALYIGGGTPSMLAPDQLSEILDSVTALASIDHGGPTEVTIECAPDPALRESQWMEFFEPLTSRASLPVTRVSTGIQAWDDGALKNMGRVDTRRAAVKLLQVVDQKFPVYNVDFVLGYPSVQGIEHEARQIIHAVEDLKAIGLSLPNVSIYQLWDVDTLFLDDRHQTLLPTRASIVAALGLVQDGLQKMRYSGAGGATFASASQYRHEWTRHRNIHFRHVGFGSGSYSFLPDGFIQRDRDIRRYIQLMRAANLSTIDRELNHSYRLTPEDIEIRRIIMGLRSGEPVAHPRGKEPKTSRMEELTIKIGRLIAAGFLDRLDDDTLSLPKDAFLLSNSISSFLHPADIPRKALD